MSRISVVPSARRLMGSLRDLGYELPQAVAELVDNSIDADATLVRVDVRFAGEDSWVRVADNGRGMTARGLDEAMRYGSAGRYRPGALGGFGLGLKTASFSQCRRLTVASRTTLRGRPEVRRWDLDEIGITDDWLLERLPPSRAPREVLEPLEADTGTVVLWEILDRVMLYRNPSGARAESALNLLRAELEQHLAMVFHRFLSNEARRRVPLEILVNGIKLTAWDPFARDERATRRLPEQRLLLAHAGRSHPLTVRPFLLPSQHRFSSPEAHHAAGGPRKWNRQQGFYVYREDRLIQSGGWNRLRTQDEHTKLARVALDIPREADEAFGVNVSKMRVTLPEAVRPELRALVTAIAARAQERYRSHVTRAPRARAENGDGVPNLAEDVRADLIPRARVVQMLRGELADEPARLRRLVDLVLTDDWGAGPAGGPAPASSENGRAGVSAARGSPNPSPA